MIDNDKQPDFEGECQIGELCYKCGAVCDEFMNSKVETLTTAEKHIEAFKRGCNAGHLVDAANYLMLLHMRSTVDNTFNNKEDIGRQENIYKIWY